MEALRPGSKPLTVNTLIQNVLPAEYLEQRQQMRTELAGRMVTMSIDGWSTPMNQSVLGVTLGDELACALDCEGKPHTSENLVMMTNMALDQCERV